MSKEENIQKMLKIIDDAWANTPSIIISTKDYVYCLFPTDPADKDNWIEASFTLQDASLEQRILTVKEALVYLLEEVTHGLPGYIDMPIVLEIADLDKIKEKIKGA
ncbi:MAG: hypothetical protein ACUVXA_00545 [Candidatus Jordarchaeum sp.]|uniref:hypothetical protein n=1 Tax=Candidatus Jordarchaeum sp. TaxID=2823881 RepID=UPI00404B3A84